MGWFSDPAGGMTMHGCFAFVFVSMVPGSATAALPSAAQILQKSAKAYGAARTFDETIRGKYGSFSGTGRLLYAKPNRVRITGKTTFNGDPLNTYDLVSDGKRTVLVNGGVPFEVASVENGVSTLTGFLASAETDLAVALMRDDTKNLAKYLKVPMKVVAETIGKQRTYRIDTPAPNVSSLWIDAKTYLLVRATKPAGAATIQVDFDPPKLNGTIPATQFKMPPKKP